MFIAQPLEDPPGGMPLLARRRQVLRSISSIHPATASRTGAAPTGLLRSGGTGDAIAWRTVRRCTSYLRASAGTGSPFRC